MNAVHPDIPCPKAESWKIFDAIWRRYDLVNRVLSFGLDIHWRKRLSKYLPQRPNLKVLDLATGTADVLISLTKNSADISAAYGIDLSENMLKLGLEKIKNLRLDQKVT